MAKISPQASTSIAALPPVSDPSPGPFVDASASAKFGSDQMRNLLSALEETEEEDGEGPIDEIIPYPWDHPTPPVPSKQWINDPKSFLVS